MGLGALRDLALSVNLEAHGVEVTLQRPEPDITPIETRGIWLPLAEGSGTLRIQRSELVRVLVLSKADVPSLPRGSIVLAPEQDGGEVKRWRVDSFEPQEVNQYRAIVVPDPEPA